MKRRHDGENVLKSVPYIKFNPMDSMNHDAPPAEYQGLGCAMPMGKGGANERWTLDVSYGEYLLAIKRFILSHWDLFLDAVSRRMSCRDLTVNELIIRAEKHGGDYHPARVVAHVGESKVSFVVNVAISPRGRGRLESEFFCLKALHSTYRRHYVPEVSFWGEERIFIGSGARLDVSMFLGEWFEGFHEFHLSHDDPADSLKMVLWDGDHGDRRALSGRETMEIYRQASFILTYYYDIGTFAEIFPWHHAAGDFVAACASNDTNVKLITVRQHAPRIGFADNSQGNTIEALLLFLANLTIRMRLDRLDGTEQTVWAPDWCVQPIINGFWDGLTVNTSDHGDPMQAVGGLILLLKNLSPGSLTELFSVVAESYHAEAPDFPVISMHLADHILEVYNILKNIEMLLSRSSAMLSGKD